MLKKTWIATILAMFFFVSVIPSPVVNAERITRKELEEIRNKKESILEAIAKKDESVKKELDKMKKAKSIISNIEKDVAKVEVKLNQAEKEFRVYDIRFKRRIRKLYQHGEMGHMAILLSADSFSQFLFRFEVIRVIVKEDYNLLKHRKDAKQKIEKELEKFQKLREKQNKEVAKSQKIYQKLMEEIRKSNERLRKLQEIEELHEEEIIQINLAHLRSGTLKFPYRGPLRRPSNLRQTSPYGYRIHPIFGTRKLHAGIDFAGPVGAPIYSAGYGVVVESRPSQGYGWLITIYHGDLNGKRVYTRYAHSYPHQVKVRVGQEVLAGEHIAGVGNNGNSTGPHLHFEVRVGNGQLPPAVNPEAYF